MLIVRPCSERIGYSHRVLQENVYLREKLAYIVSGLEVKYSIRKWVRPIRTTRDGLVIDHQ